MAQENKAFYTLNQTFTYMEIKQKKDLFSSPSQFYKTFRNPQHIQSSQQLVEIKNQTQSNLNWRPKLAPKKLLEQPRFFVSLERKRYRLKNAMKNISQPLSQNATVNILHGKKIKSKNKSLSKVKNDEALPTLAPHTSLLKYVQQERIGWQSNYRTPFLNFNMQHIIRKRKKMFTPSPQKHKDQHKIGTIRFHQQFHTK